MSEVKYVCPTCGQEAEEPNWHKARRNGFDHSKGHCEVVANVKGVVINCTRVGHCEICPIFKALCEQPEIAKGGFKWSLKQEKS